MDAIRPTAVLDEVLDFLVSAPTPQQIVEFHISDGAQQRVRVLLDQNREGTLSAEEKDEMDEISRVNNFMTLLKARAHRK